jgi:hypothetical protein
MPRSRHARLSGGLFIAVAAISMTNSALHGDCPADLNGDQAVGAADLATLLSSWGGCSGCSADIAPASGNNSVDVADLASLLAAWGNCAPSGGSNVVMPLWCDDFSLGNYSRWTGGYEEPTSCEQSGFATDEYHSPGKSHRSAIVCQTAESHRGYGGLRFLGDVVLPSFSSPSPGGINAPHGVVITFWNWLDVPYTFDTTRWLSLMTVTHDCSNSWQQVVTLNIDDSSMRLKPVHVSSVSYAPGAPAMPLRQWVRITVYLNYAAGSMHVWQNGAKVCSAAFSRPVTTMCQWHFGLYASGPNYDVVLYEDDLSMVKLLQPLTSFAAEPTFSTPTGCAVLP